MDIKDLLITNRKGVRAAFGKKDTDVTSDIEILREWLATQRHLPEIPSDNMIELFLTMNKFSIEKTKQKLDMYYTVRSLIPELYENSNPRLSCMQEIPNSMGMFVPLPKPTEDQYRVHVLKITGTPEDFDTYKFYSYVLNIVEVRIQHDIALGDVYIIDYEHLKMGHALKMTPVHIKKIVTVLEKVFSNRIKGIHVVHHPTFLDFLMTICKATLKPKIFDRIHLHNTVEEVYDFIPRELLPKDYGGEERSIQELSDRWKVCLKDHADRFDKLENMKVKEELRSIPLENDEVLGYHGNFKKLDVD